MASAARILYQLAAQHPVARPAPGDGRDDLDPRAAARRDGLDGRAVTGRHGGHDYRSAGGAKRSVVAWPWMAGWLADHSATPDYVTAMYGQGAARPALETLPELVQTGELAQAVPPNPGRAGPPRRWSSTTTGTTPSPPVQHHEDHAGAGPHRLDQAGPLVQHRLDQDRLFGPDPPGPRRSAGPAPPWTTPVVWSMAG
jgi:hypothetical protein